MSLMVLACTKSDNDFFLVRVYNNSDFTMDSIAVEPSHSNNAIYYGHLNRYTYSDYKTINNFESQLDINISINNQHYGYKSNLTLELPIRQLECGKYSISVDIVDSALHTISYRLHSD